MNKLIRAEWVKFRSVRSTLVTLVLAGAVVVLVAVLSANNIGSQDVTTTCRPASEAPAGATFDPECGEGAVLVEVADETNLADLTGGVNFAVLLFGVLGVQIIGQEYRFNTIRLTFTASPRRTPVLAAKLIVVAAACAVVAAVMVAFCWLVGAAMVDQFVVDDTDQRVAAGIVAFSALWAGTGMGVGAIVRQPIAGILILLGESLVAEQLIGVLIDGSYKWMPFTNGFQMTQRMDEPVSSGDELLSVGAGAVYFTAVAVAIWVIGAVLVNRRDA